MDKAVLKKFATESRRELMEKIKNKINMFYIDEEFNKEQKGDIYILTNTRHTLSLTDEEFKKRELLIKRIKELSIEQVIEEAAYTWFNRIIAIRYMEIHDYLPLTKDNQSLGIRVLSSKDNTPDPEILKFTNLMNPDIDIDLKKEKYAELKDDNEKFKYILLLVCKKLARVIPQVFDGITDYIDILIPDNLLNDTGFITKIIKEVPEENYSNVEIIGWLYQYYIFDLKDIYKEKYKKYDKNSLPIMTQIFTTDKIVKYMVENAIGTKLLENKIDIRKNLSYYMIEGEFKNNEIKSIENIKFIDPCCGSGHILVYAFEIFYKVYEKLGYNKKEISQIIIKKNLFGIDVDERAVQLSILSLLLKAREYDKELFNKKIEINIIAINESNSIKRNNIFSLSDNSKELLNYLLDSFVDTKEYGSILKLKRQDYSYLMDELENRNDIFSYYINNEIAPLIKLANILTQKYDILVTNPPYLGIRHFDSKLKKYAERNYSESKHDLCTIFMDTDLLEKNGILGMVNQTTWLTQDSFSQFRRKLILNKTIMSLLVLDKNIMDAGLDVCTFIIKNKLDSNYNTNYYAVSKMDDKIEYSNKYVINNQKFLNSKDCAILYNLSKALYNVYQNSTPLYEVAPTKQGLATSDNDRFLREWYEVNYNKIGFHCEKAEKYKWYPCNKGGNYRKWYGNFCKVINWENDGLEIKEYASKLYKSYTRTIKNISLYFKPGITWNSLAKELGCRIVPKGFIFETKGSMMFPTEKNLLYILGLINSKIINIIARVISPTLDFHEGPIGKLPIIIDEDLRSDVEKIVKNNLEISKKDWNSFETSWDFKKHPLIMGYNKERPYVMKEIKNEKTGVFLTKVSGTLEFSYAKWKKQCDQNFEQLKQKEEELNKIFIDIYGLQDELTPEEEDKDVTIRKADQEREIKSLISYAVGCMFGRYSLEKDGLIYAGGDFDKVYKKHKKDDGGWAGASLANYTVLNDNGKEIDLSFEVDNDNVIPITDEAYFGDDIVERFKKFISVAYGKETLNENLDFIAETLGKKGTETSEDTIRRYFVNDFFNDHVKIYQKKPIYWLFDSGKKNGFKALIYMHRYNENLVPKIRLDYLHRMQTTYEKLLSDINYKLTTELSMTDKKETQKRQADLNAKLQEIKEYDEKIAHIANQRISIDLDDGVKVNYEKFKDILAKIK